MELQSIKDLLVLENYDVDVELTLIQAYKQHFYQYDIMATIDLAMNYVQLKEEISDLKNEQLAELGLAETVNEVEEILSILKNITNDKAEKIIYEEKFRGLKKQLASYVETLIGYNDQLEACEMTLNRVSNQKVKLKDDETLVNEMVQYIMRDQDQRLIVQRYKDILRLLPIRITKDNLADRIEKAMGVYYGGYEADLDDFLESMNHTLYPHKIKGYGSILGQDIAIFDKIASLEVSSVDDLEVARMHKELERFLGKLNIAIDVCQTLTAIVNKAMVLVMGPTFSFDLLSRQEPAVLQGIKIIEKMSQGATMEQVMEHLVALEGIGEQWTEKVQQWERLINELTISKADFLEKANMKQKFDLFERVQILFSHSIFAPLDVYAGERGRQLDKGTLRKKVLSFTDEVMEIYSVYGKDFMRTKLNQLFYMLPVPEINLPNLQEWMVYLLGQTSRQAEKAYIMKEMKTLNDQLRF